MKQNLIKMAYSSVAISFNYWRLNFDVTILLDDGNEGCSMGLMQSAKNINHQPKNSISAKSH